MKGESNRYKTERKRGEGRMRIVIEGEEEYLKKLERIQELTRELYKEVSGVYPLTEIRGEEKAACENEEGGRG